MREGDNPAWSAVDHYALAHTHPADSRSNTRLLADTLNSSLAAGLPNISASAAQAKFLALHCRQGGVTHALEIGTLGGYSAIWLASSNPQLHVTTIEANPAHATVARQNIAHAGLADRIEVLQGAGLDVLPQLGEQILQARTRPPFGFVFIDADKLNNWAYFALARPLVKPGSVIVVDNIARQGRLVDAQDTSAGVVGGREVIEKVGRERGVDAVVLQTVGEKGYDGWLWVVVEEPDAKAAAAAGAAAGEDLVT